MQTYVNSLAANAWYYSWSDWELVRNVYFHGVIEHVNCVYLFFAKRHVRVYYLFDDWCSDLFCNCIVTPASGSFKVWLSLSLVCILLRPALSFSRNCWKSCPETHRLDSYFCGFRVLFFLLSINLLDKRRIFLRRAFVLLCMWGIVFFKVGAVFTCKTLLIFLPMCRLDTRL